MAGWMLLSLLWGCSSDDGVTGTDTAPADTDVPGSWQLDVSIALWEATLNHPGPVDVVVADGQAWALSLHAPTVARVDLATREVVEVLELGRLLKDGRLAVDGGRGALWLGQGKEPALLRYDLASGELTGVEVALSEVTALAFDEEQDVLWAVGNGADGGALLRLDSAGVVTERALEDKAQTLAIEPSSPTLVVGTGIENRGTVTVVERSSMEVLSTHALSGPPTAVWPLDSGVLVGLDDGVFALDEDGDATPWWQPDQGRVRAIRPDGEGRYWVLARQAERDESSGVLYGLVTLLESGGAEVLTARGGYNAQFLAVDSLTGGALSNSEGSSALVFVDAEGEREVLQTGTSPEVVRVDPDDAERFAVVSRLGEEVYIVDDGVVSTRYRSDGWPVDAAWMDDGSLLVLEHHGGRLVSVDPDSGVGTVFVEGLGSNHSLVFSTLTADGDGWTVALGDADTVVHVDGEGERLWATELGDPQEWAAVDTPDQLQVLVDGDGLWVLRTRDARLHRLDADGEVLGQWDLSKRDWRNAEGRERPLPWALAQDGEQVWVGPYRIEAGGPEADTGVSAERVLGRSGQTLLVADEEAWGPSGDPLEEIDEVYGGGVWIGLESDAVFVSRFARGTVERWVYEK